MTGKGRVLIMSPYRQLNPLVSFHFQNILGAEKVFGLNNFESNNDSARHQPSEAYLERLCLFAKPTSYSKLASLMSKGAIIKSTNITENFSYHHFLERYGETALPLLYLHNEKLEIITVDNADKIPSNVELISLLPIEAQQLAAAQKAKEETESKEVETSLAHKENTDPTI